MTEPVDEGETVQDILERSMPSLPEDHREMPEPGEFRMTMDEQRELHDLLDGLVHTLYDRGFTPNELHVVFHGIEHRLNAARYDDHEYDRIALSLRLRETIEDWKGEQDHEVPEHEVATAVEEMGRFYRTIARENLARERGRREANDD